MRVIAGRLKGRRLSPPKNDQVRPTSDRGRETLFNILAHGLGFEFSGTRVADLFAGTGALGIEALSRGALQATFVDNHAAAIGVIGDNLADLSLLGPSVVQKRDARQLLPARVPFDLVFLDPPYRRNLLPPALQSLESQAWIRPGTVIVIEIARDEVVEFPAWFAVEKERVIGDTRMLIGRVSAPNEPA